MADREPVPTGISGDFGDYKRFPVERRIGETAQTYATRAYFEELADRFWNGALTPEEEKELDAHLSAEAAQGYN